MPRKNKFISILQCSEQGLSWLRVKPSATGLEVVACEAERGHWRAEDGTFRTALVDFAQRRRLSEDAVYSVLPRHEMTVRILTLPSHDEDEIARIVRLGAEEFVPYPVEDLVLDQNVLYRSTDGHARVLAVFAHRDMVEAHIGLLRSAGIEPQDVYLSTACIASVAGPALAANKDRFALASVSGSGLEVLGMYGARLEYTRGIALSGEGQYGDGPPAAHALEEWVAEIRTSLSMYRRESEDGTGAETVYVSSDWAEATTLADTLGQETGHPCLPASFVDSVVTQGRDKLLAPPLALLGGALSAQGRAKVAISLLPSALVEVRQQALIKRNILSGGALAAACVLCLSGLYGQAVYQRGAYVRELEERIAVVRDTAQGVAAKQKQLKIMQDRLDRTGSVLDLLGQFAELAPSSGFNITDVDFKRGEGLVVKGRAADVADVYRMAERLRKSGNPYFEQTESGNLKEVQERNQSVSEYEIKATFTAPESGADQGGEDDNAQ